MAYNTKSYWTDKEKRAIQARKWSEKITKQYPENIEKCVKGTKIYDDQLEFQHHRMERMPIVELVATDSVSAVFDADHENKVAVLNFASYKNPGGRFLDGSKAQEECLCHESYLYNVLKEFEDSYYKQNAKMLNKALYTNRALYSPNVEFFRDDKTAMADVITCAAPNYTPGKRYHSVTPLENKQALESRIAYVLNIANDNDADTLILGAFGCGVFSQEPEMVAKMFLEKLDNYSFTKVVFAVPDKESDIYKGFLKVCTEFGNKPNTYVQIK